MWPALRAPRDHILMDAGDPVLNAAILQWNARTLPLTDTWWNFPAFAPAEGVTAFTEHLLGLYPVATPLIWVTGQPVAVYNLLCLLTFPLTALATFALAHRFARSAAGAAVAALAFTFSPYRVSHLSHIQMLCTFGVPLALLGLHEWVDRGARRGLLLFAAGWLLTAASNGYLMVIFGVYLIFWVIWFCSTRATIGRVPALAAIGLVATLPLVPLLLEYARIHRAYGLQRGIAEIASYGADLTGIVHPWPGAPVAAFWLDERWGEGSIFPGIAIVAFALCAANLRTHAVRSVHKRRPVTIAAVALAVVFFAAAVVAALTDVRWEIAGIRISIREIGKPLTLAVIATTIALATSRSLRPILTARSIVAFQFLMVLLMWTFSLGPIGRWNGVDVIRELPYVSLLEIPGMMALRVPARFWLMATFSLALLAGYGAARLWTVRTGRVLVIVGVVLLLAEGWARVTADPLTPFPVVTPRATDDGPVLEIPFDRLDLNTVAMLRATTGGYRSGNGYSGFEPPHFGPLRFGVRIRDASVLTELRRRTPFHISVKSDNSDGFRTWLTSVQPEAHLVAEAGGRALYSLSGLPPLMARPWQELPFEINRASCGHRLLRDLADGSRVTRWECGPGHPGQYLELDLGRVQRVSGIVNGLGAYSNDAPRALRVTVSTDGEAWSKVWEGPTGAHALRAAFDDPVRVDVQIRFAPVEARYVHLMQTADQTEWYWSIAELKIIGDY